MNGAYRLHSLSGRYSSRSWPRPFLQPEETEFHYPHTVTLRDIHLVVMKKLKHVRIDCKDAQPFLLSLKAPLLETLVLHSFPISTKFFGLSFNQPMCIPFPHCIRLFGMNVAFQYTAPCTFTWWLAKSYYLPRPWYVPAAFHWLYLAKAGTRYSQPFRPQHFRSTICSIWNIRWRNRSRVIHRDYLETWTPIHLGVLHNI